MKYNLPNILLLPATIILLVSHPVLADDDDTCLEQRAAIERQISQAQVQGNYNNMSRLQKKLNEINRYCSVDYQLLEARHQVAKYEQKVAKQRREVLEEEQKLEYFIASGNQKKILKQQQEVLEEKQELAEKEAKLANAKARVQQLEQLNDPTYVEDK